MSGSSSDHKVLASYSCGSSIYGLNGRGSDLDVTLIVEGSGVSEIRKIDGVDYFIFSADYFRKVVSYDAGALDAFKVWIDNLTLIGETLTYLDSAFESEFRKMVDVDWDARFRNWLSLNVGYFKSRLEGGCRDKSLYHVYRLRSIVERYERSGVFLSKFAEEDLRLAKDYKENEWGRQKHHGSMKGIIEHLEGKL